MTVRNASQCPYSTRKPRPVILDKCQRRASYQQRSSSTLRTPGKAQAPVDSKMLLEVLCKSCSSRIRQRVRTAALSEPVQTLDRTRCNDDQAPKCILPVDLNKTTMVMLYRARCDIETTLSSTGRRRRHSSDRTTWSSAWAA